LVKNRRFVDRDALARALQILRRRGIAYINLQGGEPLLHPQVEGLVGDAVRAGFRVALITNGWQLAQKIDGLIAAGLGTLLVSIDSHSLESHEKNRGLKGVGDRIREGIKCAKRAGVLTIASVTLNKLLRIADLPTLLDDLGFNAVSFSYPRREPFGSSSMVYGDQSNLVDTVTSTLIGICKSGAVRRGTSRSVRCSISKTFPRCVTVAQNALCRATATPAFSCTQASRRSTQSSI
jgi:MoaA/NifB/PqqE/SkfB family radical SAM enzyme